MNLTPSTEALIFHIIRTNGPINRTEIVNKTGLSKSTISLQINKLIERKLITEDYSEKEGHVKKRKLKVRVQSKTGYVIGAFLGIRKLSITLFNLTMKPVLEKAYTLDSVIDPDTTNQFIAKSIQEVLDKAKIGANNLWGIGMGFPFPVDFEKGVPDSPPNIPLWHLYPLKEFYQEKFQCPVLVDNDVNVMALGEKFAGVAQNENHFIFLKVGTGIGAGLILDNHVYRGANGCAGDIGHIAIDGENIMCHCGNLGCLETVAAAPAIAKRGLEAAMTQKSPILTAILKNKNCITSEDVGNAAQQGDIFSIQIIQDSGRQIGIVAAKLVNFSNPSMVVVGGGVAKGGTIFLAAIREEIFRRSPHLATMDLKVCFSELQEKSGPTGGGILIIEKIFSFSCFQKTVDRNAAKAKQSTPSSYS